MKTVREVKSMIHQLPTDSLMTIRLLTEVELMDRGISATQTNQAVEAAKSKLLDENGCFDGLFDRMVIPFMSEI
jgi:hypothetical protein